MDTIGYNASKGAVITFTKDLAVKWGQHEINVNAIAPGFFPTKMSKVTIEQGHDYILNATPLKRLGTEEDLKASSTIPRIKSIRLCDRGYFASRRWNERFMKEELTKQSIKLFERKGFSSTSVQDIVDSSSVTKGTFYYYFTSKESLLMDIHLRYMDDLLNRQKRILDSNESCRNQLVKIIELLINDIQAQGSNVQHIYGKCVI